MDSAKKAQMRPPAASASAMAASAAAFPSMCRPLQDRPRLTTKPSTSLACRTCTVRPAPGPCKKLPSIACASQAPHDQILEKEKGRSACVLRLTSHPRGPTGCGGAPVGVGAGQHVHPGLAALAAGALILEGRHVDEQAGVPMVRAANDGHMIRARPRLREYRIVPPQQ